MAVTLTYGATTVDLPNPVTGSTPQIKQKNNVSFLTDGGTQYVYGKGVALEEWGYSFDIGSSELTSLRTFFDAVDGMLHTFTLNDENGTNFTNCRFADDRLQVTQNHTRYTVSISLTRVA